MESCIYEGRVRHRRLRPVENAFDFPLFMLYLDLEELPRAPHSTETVDSEFFDGRLTVDRLERCMKDAGPHLRDGALDRSQRSMRRSVSPRVC